MKKTNNTKQTLLMSVLSLVLCMSMLIGTTFAWFTDTEGSTKNIVTAGNLDLDVEWAKATDAEGNVLTESQLDWKTLEEDSELFDNAGLWEPGYAQAVYLRVTNNGSLAYKYTAGTTIVDEKTGVSVLENTIKLSDILMVDMEQSKTLNLYTDREDVCTDEWGQFVGKSFHKSLSEMTDDEGVMLPKDVMYVKLGIYMPTTVGNEANYRGEAPQIQLGVVFTATQYTHESDAFGNQYDEKAEYPVLVNSADELNKALANATPGTVISLSEGVDYEEVTVDELKDIVIEGAKDSKMIFKTDADSKIENVTLNKVEFEYDGSTVDCGVVINENAEIDNLVIENCTFTGTGEKKGRGLSGKNNNASIVIKDCTFENLGYPIYGWGGYESLTVDNCTFKNIKSWAIMPQSGFDGDLTVNNCQFIDCLGGGLIKAGTLTAGHTFTFTNNTITGCTVAGDHNWFQFNVSAGNTVIENNIKDGSAWTPGTAEGLK